MMVFWQSSLQRLDGLSVYPVGGGSDLPDGLKSFIYFITVGRADKAVGALS